MPKASHNRVFLLLTSIQAHLSFYQVQILRPPPSYQQQKHFTMGSACTAHQCWPRPRIFAVLMCQANKSTHGPKDVVFPGLYPARGRAPLVLVILPSLGIFLEVPSTWLDISSSLPSYLAVWLQETGAASFLVELPPWVLLSFNLCTCCTRAVMGFPSHLLMLSPQSHRKNHSSPYGVYPLSLAGGHLHLVTEPLVCTDEIWRRFSSIFFLSFW